MGNLSDIENTFCIQNIEFFKFLGNVINMLKILLPIIILIRCTIDVYKVLLSNEDITSTVKIALKRILVGLLIFFIPSILDAAFSLMPVDDKFMISSCTTCAFNAKSDLCTELEELHLVNVEEEKNMELLEIPETKEQIIPTESNVKPSDANNNIISKINPKGQGWDAAPTFENTDCSVYTFSPFGNYINQYPDDLLENLAGMNLLEVGMMPKKNFSKYWTGYLMETAVFVNNYYSKASILGYDIDTPINIDDAAKLLKYCWCVNKSCTKTTCLYIPKYAYLTFERVEKMTGTKLNEEQREVAKKAVEIVLNGDFTISKNIIGAMGKSVKREGKNILYQSKSGQIFFSKQKWKNTDIYGNEVSLSPDYYYCLGNSLYDYYYGN